MGFERLGEKKPQLYEIGIKDSERVLEYLKEINNTNEVHRIYLDRANLKDPPAFARFLQDVSKENLPFEVLIEQNREGDLYLETGYIDSRGIPTAGSNVKENLENQGPIHIHSHPSPRDGNDILENTAPSEGDLRVYALRNIEAGIPNLQMIFNSEGFSLVGVNPHIKEFSDRLRKLIEKKPESLTQFKDYVAITRLFLSQEGLDSICELFPSMLFGRAKIYAYHNACERIANASFLSIDDKMKYIHDLSCRLGLVLRYGKWGSDEKNNLSLVFSSEDAEKFWKSQIDRIIADLEQGRETLESLHNKDSKIADDFVSSIYNR